MCELIRTFPQARLEGAFERVVLDPRHRGALQEGLLPRISLACSRCPDKPSVITPEVTEEGDGSVVVDSSNCEIQ